MSYVETSLKSLVFNKVSNAQYQEMLANGEIKEDEFYITPSDDTEGSSGGLLYVGSLMSYAGSTAPDGWLVCNGQEVSRTTYSKLFEVIGTTYGEGDGSTTFNVPTASDSLANGVVIILAQ